MVRNVDRQSRRRAVLAATINNYIKEAQPVASDNIADDFDLSSATIRNIFSDLEESGYLTHPYTSGGRVPTSKGYRYYVDFLLSQMDLLSSEKERIVKEYRRQIERLEDVLERTSEIISVITHYAGIVSFLERQEKLFYNGISCILEQPEFQDLEKMRLIIKLIEEKERLMEIINRDFSGKSRVYIGEELECPEMTNCTLIVSSYRLKDKPSGRLAVLGPTRMEYDRTILSLEYISDILTDELERF